jgi:hypothetical protein
LVYKLRDVFVIVKVSAEVHDPIKSKLKQAICLVNAQRKLVYLIIVHQKTLQTTQVAYLVLKMANLVVVDVQVFQLRIFVHQGSWDLMEQVLTY